MDTQLKQRLIGGAVLVALAVIFLPMLVQGPAPDSGVGDVSTRVPDAPGGEYETRELPLGPEAATAGQSEPPVPEATVPAQSATAAPANASTAAARPDPGVAAGQWAVTFGAYAGERDAQAVLSRLRQAGLAGFIEQDTINGRQAWRVRVGPFADRALAEAGRLQAVRIRSDVNAQVIALDAGNGAAPAPATAPAATVPTTPATPAASQAAAAPATPAVRTEALPPETAAARPTASTAARPTPPAPAPAAPKPAAPAAEKPAPAAAAPAAASVGFAVQMGAFASAADANALRDRLRAGGFSAIVQPVRTDKGTLNRVRVGPVTSRDQAEQLKARLAGGGFGPGMVVPHP
ncbi:MAG: SPOR domain-containing protein [Pseudoxanthomonas sp.]|nr:SPOR domain-containing protein [Pseudoxanthomonas sp.]